MKKYFCYILFSPILNKYYTGSTSNDVATRTDQHLNKLYGSKKFTAAASDWIVFLKIQCVSYKQAMSIEKHIEKMKSRTYIENLKKYPELVAKLIERFME